ncbi:DnaJ subfamily C member 13 [Cichlidogyrus casuarinus]|uniref:DnaJ subfamily C member 13 n=1 Tax=Cichlidogyrus casuarinus TaxID=1844966 RepID=A0ABD2QC24_9PLAT
MKKNREKVSIVQRTGQLLLQRCISINLHFSSQKLTNMCCQAASCIAAFCTDFWLCQSSYNNGALYLLLPHVFQYDFTLEESGVEHKAESNVQVRVRKSSMLTCIALFLVKALKNRLALLCLWAIGGLLRHSDVQMPDKGHPVQLEEEMLDADCPDVTVALSHLLTPYLTRRLTELKNFHISTGNQLKQAADASEAYLSPFPPTDFPKETPRGKHLRDIAKLLTTNSTNPCLIWDNNCRSELTNFLDSQVQRVIRQGECNLHAAAQFVHSSFANELLIGEIFIRIYNSQTDFPLDNPKAFAIDLLHYVSEQMQLLLNNEFETDLLRRKASHDMQAALEALRNVTKVNPGLEIQCIGRFGLLFQLLELDSFPEVQLATIEVIDAISVNSECLLDLAASDKLTSAVLMFRSLPHAHASLVETFQRLIVLTELLKQFVYCGGLIYLLHCLVHSPDQDIRLGCCDLFSKAMANKQVGRRIQALLNQYLPKIFVDSMRESSESFLHLFDGCHKNPELIWNAECREVLANTLTDGTDEFHEQQKQDRKARWSVPDSYRVCYKEAMIKMLEEDRFEPLPRTGEHSDEQSDEREAQRIAEARLGGEEGPVAVSGVYLYLYAQNPGWVLRQPEIFLDGIMTKWIEVTLKELPGSLILLRLVTRCILAVLQDRPGLLDSLPRKGYVHRLCDQLSGVKDLEGSKSVALIIHKMTTNKLCVASMADRDTIGSLISVMQCCQGQELGLIGEILFNVFDTPNCEALIAQALEHDLIGYVMTLLQDGLPPYVKNAGQTRAYLVKTLKAMQRSPIYGARISARLDEFPGWAEFRDQSHALFISNAPQSAIGYLTAPNMGNSVHAQYLTAGPSVSASREPPRLPE